MINNKMGKYFYEDISTLRSHHRTSLDQEKEHVGLLLVPKPGLCNRAHMKISLLDTFMANK